MSEHHTKTETAFERITDTWFFTQEEMIKLCEEKLGQKMPEGAKVQFYPSYSPAYVRWQENPNRAPGPIFSNGFTLMAVVQK